MCVSVCVVMVKILSSEFPCVNAVMNKIVITLLSILTALSPVVVSI